MVALASGRLIGQNIVVIQLSDTYGMGPTQDLDLLLTWLSGVTERQLGNFLRACGSALILQAPHLAISRRETEKRAEEGQEHSQLRL